ncbi:hypothetical protein NIES4073_21350 [Kalymmatonema gypsitolerans NIES-4073]|nr:hypothetical protein NIES4073_21350 [Scytonema sp. NIES-4073]
MITLENFQPWLDIDAINDVMKAACVEAAKTPRALYVFMQRYVCYGRTFSSSVPTLAGTISSSHLLQDPTCSVPMHAGRSMDVAAKVLAASIEEFTDPRTGVSHGTLSYALLDKLAEYANLSQAEINTIYQSGTWLSDIISYVKTAYKAESDSLESLVSAIGFHVATETVGDNEFGIINDVLFSQHRNNSFGRFIRNSKVSFQQGTVSPWYWIVIHGTSDSKGVELKHSAEAFAALNYVVRYSNVSEQQIIEWAGQGFAEFAYIQTKFFQQVQQELRSLETALAV